ncbi:efflux RND transporter permease subunit [Nostoc sp. UCD121]|uniref:efflux RND transporter permease subunit n=1 Tax=unclassified Nostoc TaxID=2593658 RepID=UPI0016275DDA|nr:MULTISPECIES: efflux RND transporter permease subunit [unclassified Nostoc]MBC1219064.1 efflux RND transporter permease subunit [Nostoc sp. UCD120]MBC1275015.1 efflux RND transporter permease subunit [Nostoc sp. UCD121]MBC1293691.1 efflux RND transporter permease subunit [Nostoc sp. UCD122]
MFVNTFIKRPVLTTVCTFIILLLGSICIPILPISQLPDLAPVQITVSSNNIGADAQTTENTVTNIIERQINGVKDVSYISSNTGNDGSSNITVSFPTNVNSDIAQVNVQNKEALASPQLPDTVQRTGVTVETASSSLLLVYGFYSENNEYDNIFISNYVDLYILDQIKRLPGVGSARVFGERKYAMRLWLDPNKLAQHQLTPQDVTTALQQQNIQVGAGAIGKEPAPDNQSFEFALRATSRFKDAAEFEDMVLKVSQGGINSTSNSTTNSTLVKVRDVGRVELGAENYLADAKFTIPGHAPKAAVGLGIYQLPGSNALDVAHAVEEKIVALEKSFPPGLKAQLAFDTTPFVEISLEEVLHTLVEAIILVVLVIFVFLQDWRTTIIPTVAIPVSLIGTCAALLVLGFQINTLTLFGFVLAIGIVVDDAIIVVEAVAVKLEQGMRPFDAAVEAMKELTGAIIATSLVLMAVFIPVAFIPGTTGIVYKQFALTVACSIAISTFNALTFSPSMAAILMRPAQTARGPLGWFFTQFNRGFSWFTRRYVGFVSYLTHVKPIVIGVFITGLVATVLMYRAVPTGFIPEEDQGYFFVIVQGPDGVSLKYTESVMDRVVKEVTSAPEVKASFMISGFGFDGNASNLGIAFANLKPWKERAKESESVYGILQRLNKKLSAITEARAIAVNAPPVRGLSSTGGFEFIIQDRTGSAPIETLVETAQKFIAAANKKPVLQRVFTQFTADTPQFDIQVNRNQAKALNVEINDIFGALQTYLGSQYVNNFVQGQRQYRVYVQADGVFRSNPDDIGKLYVRSANGAMIPLSSLVKVTPFVGPKTIAHYNLYRSIKVQGAPASGSSSGEAIKAMEQVAAEVLPQGFGYEWTGTYLQEKKSGGATGLIFALAIVIVFLVLAAQYESYVDPIIILLTVPLAVLGAMTAIWLRSNIFMAGSLFPKVVDDIYCQVGLVTLIGLAAKNAILVVEFANQLHEQGMSYTRAAVKAGQERLRPILMTSFAALLGFLPLVISQGAGASSRWSLGTALFGGLLLSTFLSLFLVPILYILVKTLAQAIFSRKRSGGSKPPDYPNETSGSGHETLPTGITQPDTQLRSQQDGIT